MQIIKSAKVELREESISFLCKINNAFHDSETLYILNLTIPAKKNVNFFSMRNEIRFDIFEII